MKRLYEKVHEFLRQDARLALATIVEARGSTPREVGAKMIIHERGQITGTVGGGCGENQVFQDALRVMKEGRPRFSRVDLTGEINENTETNCGGIMDVFIDPLRSRGISDEEIIRSVLDIYAQRDRAALITILQSEDPRVASGCKLTVKETGEVTGWREDQTLIDAIVERALSVIQSGRSARMKLKDEKLDVFFEVIAPPAEIVIVGAGHIAQPLSRMAKIMEFEVTVIDDRSNFANRSRFAEADRIIVDDIEKAVSEIPIGSATHIVLVTRGHQMDQAALLKVISSRAAYIGMIGSRRRVGAVFDYLRRQGVAQELIEKVYAPIGIDIGAETPDEIALSIMAEIIKLRRQGGALSLSEGRKRPSQFKHETV
ncbi:MAG: XdhC/CoxI family protein [Acidobacteriota bacterium]